MRSLKIAWCHHGDSGGSKRAAFEMVRELSRRGHLIDEYILRDSPPNLEHFPMTQYVRRTTITRLIAPRQGIRPYLVATWFAAVEEAARGWGRRAVFRELAAQIHGENYDLVHVDQIARCLATGLLPFLRIPSIVYSHEASLARYLIKDGSPQVDRNSSAVRTAYSSVCEWGTATSQWVRDRRDLRNSRWAWLVLTNSGYSRDTYMNRYRRAASVCTYGVDAERFRPLGIPREDLVLSVGRLVEPKQHHQVIEAIGHLPVGERPRLTIATPEWKNRLEDPFYHDHLRQSAADRGVDLEILHDPPQDELVRLYNRARAVVFVPRMEPFGLVALEGMACGTPVIGVSEGGVRESVRDGVTGFLVPRDPQAIAARIALLFKQPATQQQMGVDAARYVREEWTWSRTIDQYEEHTNHLLQSGKVP